MIFTLIGFFFVFWLLASPGWRVFRIRRLTEDGVRTQLNRWLVSWFALSLLATVAWMCLYWCSCTSNNTPKDNTQKNCLWRHADIYMNTVIITAFVTNLTWLIRLSSIDPKKTLFHFGIAVAGACILVIFGAFVFAIKGCWRWLRLAGGIAVVLGSAATFCRQMSMERQEFSLFALSVGSAAVLPELMWILEVICVEQFTEIGKKCGFYEVFFELNFYWKLSWTINSLIRLPELIRLIKQIDAPRRMHWRIQIFTGARRFFGRNREG